MTRLDATAFLDSLGCAHVLYFHDDSKITKDTEFGFIKKGVEKQEHCFYTTQNPEMVLRQMNEFGIDTEAHSKFLHIIKIIDLKRCKPRENDIFLVNYHASSRINKR